MKDILIEISKETRMINISKSMIGIDNENLQNNLVFKFTDEFVNGTARLEYVLNREKHFILLKKEQDRYIIPIKNILLKKGQINMQLVITESETDEGIPVFKSNIFYVKVNEAINADSQAPDEYQQWIDIANAKLSELDDAIDDCEEAGNYATIQGNFAKETAEELLEYAEEGKFNGKDALINGVNTITINAGTNISLDQQDGVLTINNTYSDEDIQTHLNSLEELTQELDRDLSNAQNDIENLETTQQGIIEDVAQISEDLELYALVNETGNKIEFDLDTTTFKLKAKLKNKNGVVIHTSNEIDLPLESLVLNVTYDNSKKELVITLQNGTITRVPVGELISGLVSEAELNQKLTEYVKNEELENYVDNEKFDALAEKVAEIELTKFPNAIIHGEPTINNGQISNFTRENYLSLPAIFDLHDRGFEFNFAIRTGSNVTTAQNIIGSRFCMALLIENSKLKLKVSQNGSSWDLVDIESNINIQPNTTYYVQINFNKLIYKLRYSLDGITYTDVASKVASVSPNPAQIYLGVGNNFFNPFGGIINLNKCNLKVNNSIIWQGMDDAGLQTRMATDMENIDEAGIEKIDEIVNEKGYIKLDKIEPIIPKKEAIGTNTLEYDNALEFEVLNSEIEGNEKQDNEPSPDYPQEVQTLKGYNLFNIKDWVLKGNNSNYYAIENNKLNIKKLDTRTFNDFLDSEKIYLPNGKYILSGNDSALIRIYNKGNNATTETNEFEVTLGYIYVKFISNTIININPMISTEEKPYLPFNCIGKKYTGRNLINMDEWLTKKNASYTKEKNVYSCSNFSNNMYRDTYELKLKPNTKYKLSCKYHTQNTVNPRMEIYSDTMSFKAIYLDKISASSSNSVIFITDSSTNYYLRLNYTTLNYPFIIDEPMICEDTDIDYEPYQEHIQYIDLAGNELLTIDKLITDYKCNAHIEKKWEKLVLDGVTTNKKFSSLSQNTNNRAAININGSIKNIYTDKNSYCTHFNYNTTVYRDSLNEVGYVQGVKTFYFRFGSESEINTLDKANNWLKEQYDNGTPVIIYYQLETPEIIELPKVEPVKSLEGYNHVELLATLEPTYMKNVYANDVNKEIEKLKQALLSTGANV